jgi:hypothetical protein
MRSVAFPALVALALCGSSTARAEPNFEEAGKHFAAAKQAFEVKHFRIAATEFQKAYDVTKDPLLLYNVGEAWEKAGEAKKAVASYRAYLRAQPKAQDRADVDKRVKAIIAKKYQIDSESAPGDDPNAAPPASEATALPSATTPPSGPPTTVPPASAPPTTTSTPPTTPPSGAPPGTPPSGSPAGGTVTPDFMKEPASGPAATSTPPTPAPASAVTTPPAPPEAPPAGFLDRTPPTKMRIVAWVGVAVTVAVLTAGAIFGLAAQSRADEITRRETFIDMMGQPKTFTADEQTTYRNLRDEGNLYNGLAIGFFSVAAATAVATTVLFVVDYKRRPAPQAMRIEPTFGPRGGGLALTWRFP